MATKFVRTEEMVEKMTLDSFGGEIVMDSTVTIIRKGSKLKAYAPAVGAYVQFPRRLRTQMSTYSRGFTADLVECCQEGKTTFYRAYKGTIRDENGNVVG